MSIEAVKYAARQISRHFEMLNHASYKKTRVDNFIDFQKLVTKRLDEKTLGPDSKNIFYSATVPPLKVKETLPAGYHVYLREEWAYSPVKMEYEIIIEKTGDKLDADNLTLENVSKHFNSIKIFRAYITTETIEKQYETDPKIKKLLRPIPKLLKRYTANIVVVDNKTSHDDILIQLIVLALKDGFIEMDEEIVTLFRSYIKKRIRLNKCGKQFIKDFLYPQKGVPTKNYLSAQDILLVLVRNYIRPYNTYTFRIYIKKMIEGLHKEEKRKDGIFVPKEFKTMQPKSPRQEAMDKESATTEEDEAMQPESPYRDRVADEEMADMSHFQNGRTESINNFQIFCDKKGNRIGMGVDRAAMEFGTSRDKIYRFIREEQIKPKKIEGTYVLDIDAGRKLRELLQKKAAYKELVADISNERNIKPNSARKRIRRKQKRKHFQSKN